MPNVSNIVGIPDNFSMYAANLSFRSSSSRSDCWDKARTKSVSLVTLVRKVFRKREYDLLLALELNRENSFSNCEPRCKLAMASLKSFEITP